MLKPELELLSTHKTYLASKWIHQQVLLDPKELEDLFSHLGVFWLFPIGKVVTPSSYALNVQRFLQVYEEVIQGLKTKSAEIHLLNEVLPCAIAKDVKDLYLFKVKDNVIVKIQRPAILMQLHTFCFSHQEKKFRSMVLRPDRIFWGIQFSYPQIYQDSETRQYFKVDQKFSSTEVFWKLRKWLRSHTLPTPFIAEQQKINAPMRLGKKCFPWINSHPQFAKENLQVAYAN